MMYHTLSCQIIFLFVLLFINNISFEIVRKESQGDRSSQGDQYLVLINTDSMLWFKKTKNLNTRF